MNKIFIKFIIVIFSVTLFCQSISFASESLSTAPGENGNVGNMPIADGTAFLSSFQGDHEVSLFSGSLNYNYPLWVPEGRVGMTPNINLTYSNVDYRYSSPVGYGWSIPTNAIYRVRKKGLDTMYSSDYYMADVFGKSEELIVIDSTNDVYAPKYEGSFNEYTFSGTHWTAKDAKGNTYTFGQNATGRQYDLDDTTRVYKWMLEKIEDMNGNYIAFTYQKDGNAIYPKEIFYTGYGTDTGLFEIEFTLTDRGSFTSYNTGFKVEHKKIIDKIDLISHEGVTPETLLTYNFDYSSYNNAIYLLDEISVTDGTNTLPSTEFDYFDGTESVAYKKINGLYKITEPYGGTHTFTYKPASAYRESNGGSSNMLPFVVYTVYEHKAQESSSAPVNTTTYDYRDGHYYYDDLDAYKREYAGFGKVTVEDPAGNERILYFHQSENDPNNSSNNTNGEYQDHISKKGRIYRTEQYDDSDNLRKLTIQKWDKNTLSDDDTEFDRYFVYLDRKTTVDYGENSQSKTVSKEYTYDSYGNVTQAVDYGEVTLANQAGDFTDTGSDKLTTDISYVYDTTDRLLRFPKQVETKDNSNNVISREKNYYDDLAWGQIGEGLLTDKDSYVDTTNYVTTQWGYNSYGLVTSVTNPRNYTTSYTYDSTYLYPVTVTNAKSQETDYEYDNFFGKVTKITDPNNFITEKDYDGFSRPEEVRIKNTSGVMKKIMDYAYNLTSTPPYTTETAYPDNTDNQSNVIEVTKRTYYDGFARPVQSKVESEGSSNYIVSSMTYDELGQVEEEYLPKTSTSLSYESINTSDPKTTYTYDALGRVKTAVNSLGTTTNVYNNWWMRVTDPNSEQKDYYYDARGNLIEVKEYLNSTAYSTEYDYSPLGNLIKITDADDNEKEMTYDWLGRKLTEEFLHDSSESNPKSYSFTYDANGNVATRTDGKNQTIAYTYDQLDRVLTENTNEVTYGYDSGTNGIGHLTSVIFGSNSKSYEYNILGNLIEETLTLNSTDYDTAYAYDLFGNVLSITYPDSSTASYVYNNANQIESITNYVTDIDYSPIGGVSYIEYDNDVTTTNTYDPTKLYRLTDKVTTDGTDNFQDISYTYDAVGNITAIDDDSATNAGKDAAYVYDDLHRLTSATITNTINSDDYTRTYTYSIIGNVSSKSDQGSYTYSNIHPHAVTTIGATTYTYDDNGSLTGDGTWTHTYDTRNRLTSSTDGNDTITYTYDEGNTRVTKSDGIDTNTYVNRYYKFDNTTVKKHIYAGNLKIATIDGANTVFHHNDHLSGSNVETDTNGDVIELLDYFPYGSTRLDEKAGSYDNNYKFTGQEYDSETGLYYYGSRYYNADIGRFTSLDPLVLDMAEKSGKKRISILKNPQALNAYSYVLNNPLIYTDPTGEHEFHLSFTTNIGIGASAGATWSIGFATDGSYGITSSVNAGGLAGADASIGLGLGYSSAETWGDTEGNDVYTNVGGKIGGGGDLSLSYGDDGAKGVDIELGAGPSSPIYVGAGVSNSNVKINRNIIEDFNYIKQEVSEAVSSTIDLAQDTMETTINFAKDSIDKLSDMFNKNENEQSENL